MACAHRYPFAFTDIKFCAVRMHKVKFPEWVLLMQIAISLQGSAPVRTRIKHGEAVKVTLLIRCGMGFQGFDDEPLVRIGLTYLSPEHVISFSSASLRLWEHTVVSEYQRISHAPPTCASAASAWGSQKVMSMSR